MILYQWASLKSRLQLTTFWKRFDNSKNTYLIVYLLLLLVY